MLSNFKGSELGSQQLELVSYDGYYNYEDFWYKLDPDNHVYNLLDENFNELRDEYISKLNAKYPDYGGRALLYDLRL
jgi:hypothetical protein